MYKILIPAAVLSMFLVSCGHKTITARDVINAKPSQSSTVDVTPVHEAVDSTSISIDATHEALRDARVEVDAAERQTSEAQQVIVSYETLVDELEATNTVMAQKFADLGKRHRELELERQATIQSLSVALEHANTKLESAEEHVKGALEYVYKLEDEVFANKIELENYRTNYESVIAAMKDTEEIYKKDIAKAEKEARKADARAAKYKSYHTIFWIVFALIVIAIAIAVGVWYLRRTSPIGLL